MHVNLHSYGNMPICNGDMHVALNTGLNSHVLQRDDSHNSFNAMLHRQLSFEIKISKWEWGHCHMESRGPGTTTQPQHSTAAT